MTQSAVSQQVSALEGHFKATLIERSRKKFRLTREGEVLYDYSKQIMQGFVALGSKIEEIKHVISGTIRVSTIYSIGLHDLPSYLRKFLQTHPTVNVHVEYRRSNQVYQDVTGNTVDLGLVAYPVRDPRLEIVLLRKDPLVVICHPAHPLAKARSIGLTALQGQNFVAFEPDLPTRRATELALREAKVEVNNVMEFDNVETVKRAVEINVGVSIVPHSTVLQEIATQTLTEVKLSDGKLARPLAVIHKKTKVLTPAMKEFIALLKTA